MLPVIEGIPQQWNIMDYDQSKEQDGTWEWNITFNPLNEDSIICLKVVFDLTEYPEKEPGIQLMVDEKIAALSCEEW